MRPISQSRAFSVCLHGWTIPKNSLYGSVYGTEYVCVNTKMVNGGYNILVYSQSEKRGQWIATNTKRGHGAIYVRIRDFIKTPEFCKDPIVYCHSMNKQERENAAERAEMRREAAERRKQAEARKKYREMFPDAPTAKKSQSEYMYRCKPVHADIDYECVSGLELDGYQPVEAVTGKVDFVNKPFFEQGQNTCGTAGEYTRSGFETKDGMKTRFADYRGQKTERPMVSNPYKVCKDEATGKYYRTFNGRRIEED